MKTTIYILNATHLFDAQENKIRSIIRSVVAKARQRIFVDDIDIIVQPAAQPKPLKKIDGIGAYCPSPHFIQLSIDTTHPSYKTKLVEIIERSLLHELHHAARLKAGICISEGTLLEAVFSEGLADLFVEEMTGKLPMWSQPLNKKRSNGLILKLQKNQKKKIDDELYRKWFLEGSRKEGIPQWAGYALGLQLLKRYIKHHPANNVITLIHSPASKVHLFE